MPELPRLAGQQEAHRQEPAAPHQPAPQHQPAAPYQPAAQHQSAPQPSRPSWVAQRAPDGMGQPLPPFPRLAPPQSPAGAHPAPAPKQAPVSPYAAPPAPAAAPAAPGEPRHADPAAPASRAPHDASLPEWSLILADGVAVPLYGPVVVGRNPSGDRFPGATLAAVPDNTRTMSKTHARFYLDDGVPMVDDLGSTNGIALFPGGNTQGAMAVEPGAPAEVRSGDIVQLGEYEITVRRN